MDPRRFKRYIYGFSNLLIVYNVHKHKGFSILKCSLHFSRIRFKLKLWNPSKYNIGSQDLAPRKCGII